MGWASGSELMCEIAAAAKKYIKDPKTRTKFYIPIIEAFNGHDWDTHGECEDANDPALIDALRKTGDWYEDEDGDRLII